MQFYTAIPSQGFNVITSMSNRIVVLLLPCIPAPCTHHKKARLHVMIAGLLW